jgi:hypothetical protein
MFQVRGAGSAMDNLHTIASVECDTWVRRNAWLEERVRTIQPVLSRYAGLYVPDEYEVHRQRRAFENFGPVSARLAKAWAKRLRIPGVNLPSMFRSVKYLERRETARILNGTSSQAREARKSARLWKWRMKFQKKRKRQTRCFRIQSSHSFRRLMRSVVVERRTRRKERKRLVRVARTYRSRAEEYGADDTIIEHYPRLNPYDPIDAMEVYLADRWYEGYD